MRSLRPLVEVVARMGLGLGLALVVGCGPTSFLITPVAARQPLTEEVVQREAFWAPAKVALIDVDGLLQNAAPSGLLGIGGEHPVALGEAVKVGDKFGLRITSVRLPDERFVPLKRKGGV